MTFGEGFVYATLRDELVVGEVYVRVYNVQPTFVLEVCM
jgi:DnaJ family protein C protein 13